MVAETAIAINDQPRDVAAIDFSAIEQVIIVGDLSKLTPQQRSKYYFDVCRSVGLNPFTRPFDYINLSGKLTLYAKKDAGDQLRKLHGVSIQVTARERIDDLYVVTARATSRDGRADEEIGAVPIGTLKGDALANAMMKATTKAKRRVTLSICGLGLLDETELETISNAVTVGPDPLFCEACEHEINGQRFRDGSSLTADEIAERSMGRFGRTLCVACSRAAVAAAEQGDEAL